LILKIKAFLCIHKQDSLHRSQSSIEFTQFIWAFLNDEKDLLKLTSFYFKFIYFNFIRMNIYIGNLSYKVKESDLNQVLEEYGTVNSVKLIIDRDTRRSKGFAFAEMPDQTEAENVIKELNGAEFEGRQMVVKEALPKA